MLKSLHFKRWQLLSGLIPEEGNQAFLPDWALLSMAALMKALNSG